MQKNPCVLWLIWQNQKTRQRYHIGNLFHENGKYIFSYELSGKRRTLKEALENGYKPHLSFRNLNKTYVSDRLFGPFERRLPDKRRPDFDKILKNYGLPPDYTEMDLLRATGGRLATDPYEFVAPIRVFEDRFNFDFYIAGWRYYDGEKVINQLKEGAAVRFQLEPSNKEDEKAVIVLSEKGEYKLGYIPAFYSGFMYEMMEEHFVYEARIEKVSPMARPQSKVSISVTGCLANGFFVKNGENVESVHVLV